MTLPSMGENNIYHVAGPLVVAKDQQLEYLLCKLAPIMEWRPEMLIILITPCTVLRPSHISLRKVSIYTRARTQKSCTVSQLVCRFPNPV